MIQVKESPIFSEKCTDVNKDCPQMLSPGQRTTTCPSATQDQCRKTCGLCGNYQSNSFYSWLVFSCCCVFLNTYELFD